MSSTNNIEVKLRIRPFNEAETAQLMHYNPLSAIPGQGVASSSIRQAYSGGSLFESIAVIDHKSIKFDEPKPGRPRGRRPPKDRLFEYDRIFGPHASQREVYEETTKELLNLVLDGFNATALAYGATGCGKTHTTSGTKEDPGLIPLTMDDLFVRVDEEKEIYESIIEITMIEVYNENVYDLLSDSFDKTPRRGLPLLEDGKRRITVAGVQSKQPTSTAEVMELIMLGNERRSTNATACNATSSRSHAVLQVNVKRRQKHQHDVDVENETVSTEWTTAVLTIIDLAGSERAAATQNMGARMKEGANINKSLLALGSVINSLATGKAGAFVNYRSSKLTRLLQFSLGGNCRTVMIACVSCSSRDLEETWNSLLYAERTKKIKTTVSRNTAGVAMSARKYVEEISKQAGEIAFLRQRILTLEHDGGELERKKLNEARSIASAAMKAIMAEVNKQMPYIVEGAETRAKWDAAEIVVNPLNRRIKAIDSGEVSMTDPEQEKALCSTVIGKHRDAYHNNRSVQNVVNSGYTQRTQLEAMLKQTEQRKFSDILEPVDREYIRLSVEYQRQRVAMGVMESEEKGYRDALAAQAEVVGKLLAALADQQGRVQAYQSALAQAISAGGALDQLEALQSDMRKGVSHADTTIRQALDVQVSRAPASTLPPPQAIKSPLKLNSSTSSNRGTGSEPPSAIALASPAIKRLLDPSVFTSPIRSPTAGAHAHIFKSKPPTLSFAATASALAASSAGGAGGAGSGGSGIPAPQKAFRWTDMAGEGSLEEIKMITPRTSAGSSMANTSADVSITEGDVSTSSSSRAGSTPPSAPATRSMLPPPSRGLTASLLMPPPPVPASSALSSLSSSVTDGASGNGNDWRSFRSAQAKERSANSSIAGGDISISNISTISGLPRPSALAPIGSYNRGETSIAGLGSSLSSSSPVSSGTLAPSRPGSAASGALREATRQIPGPRPSTSMSNLMKPTASSIARMGGAGGAGGNGSDLSTSTLGLGSGPARPSVGRASLAMSTSERRPSTGPLRPHKLIKARDSVVPYNPKSTDLEDPSSSPERVNPLSTGPRRAAGNTTATGSASSTSGGPGSGATGIRRPRESIPPSIRHTAASARRMSAIPQRQSIANLSRAAGLTGTAGVGNTSLVSVGEGRVWK